MRISEHVDMLRIAGDHGESHLALIHDGQALALVDTGYPGDLDKIREAIQEAGFAAERLTHILLTHQDIDHVGSAKELAALSGAQICAHEEEAPYIQGDKTPVKLAQLDAAPSTTLTEAQRAWQRTLRDGFKRSRVPVALWLRDGESLSICGGVAVVHTPGHTPGHACYYVGRDGVMVAGDALHIADGKLAGANPAYTADTAQAAASNRKLAAYPATLTITYHGGLYAGDLRAALAELDQSNR
jgi:glyoxylase-like metal-dependent hydrolase (beta-lactamase superfamily II)